MSDSRKKHFYEAAKLIAQLAERKTINYTEQNAYNAIAKILRKEGRDPGAIERWLALDRPTRGIV